MFWAAAVQALGPHGTQVCRYLVNCYAGQGAAKRMNKKIKRARNNQRNRQLHQVTSAYVELYIHIHGEDGKNATPKEYLLHLKDQIDELRYILPSKLKMRRRLLLLQLFTRRPKTAVLVPLLPKTRTERTKTKRTKTYLKT